jgi:hypothetical protein
VRESFLHRPGPAQRTPDRGFAYQLKITECENKIERQFEQLVTKLDFDQVLEQSGALKVRSAKVRLELQRQAYLTSVCEVDLTRLPGLSTLAVEGRYSGTRNVRSISGCRRKKGSTLRSFMQYYIRMTASGTRTLRLAQVLTRYLFR